MRRFALLLLLLFAACKSVAPEERGKKILHTALRTKIGSMDPLRCGTQYDNVVVSAIFEPLFQYAYLKRPYELEPNLLVSMPEVSEDKLTYTFTLKSGVRFQDDPAFAGGKGRELTSADVIYSIKRMADIRFQPTGWWVYNNRITGFDAYKKSQQEQKRFDYDVPVEGLEVVDPLRFRIHLTKPFPQFLNILGMCYASIVAREVVEKYGEEIGLHPVGTGPFQLKQYLAGTKVVLEKNPNYRLEKYPTAEGGELTVPELDGVVMHIFEQDQPMWLKWRVRDLDFIQVPSDYFDVAFDAETKLRKTFREEGISVAVQPKLDFIFRAFNMEDPLVGQGEKGRLLRQALSLALDTSELADSFYNNTAVCYDGPIPPGLEGHEPGIISKYRGPQLELAKKKLAEAGYPNGQGLPKIRYHTNRGGNSAEQTEMVSRQFRKIGVELEVNIHSFPELDAMIQKRKAQMFNFSWGSDYPDAENNLAMFYTPNSTPGSNLFNYSNPAYDALYDQAKVMLSSTERTELYKKMRDIIIEDVPAIGSMARTRYFLANPRVKNLRPDETWYTWIKYVRVEAAD